MLCLTDSRVQSAVLLLDYDPDAILLLDIEQGLLDWGDLARFRSFR